MWLFELLVQPDYVSLQVFAIEANKPTLLFRSQTGLCFFEYDQLLLLSRTSKKQSVASLLSSPFRAQRKGSKSTATTKRAQ